MNSLATLYVCKNNVGRSQMAQGYHNHLAAQYDGRLAIGEAFSAGTHVDKPGSLVKDWVGGPDEIIAAVKREGIDIADNTRTQLDSDSLRGIGRVVFLNPESAHDYLDSLDADPGFPQCIKFWHVEDPHYMASEEVRTVFQQIKGLVGDLVIASCVEAKPLLL
jgi:protein-tyrosine-phosphatase